MPLWKLLTDRVGEEGAQRFGKEYYELSFEHVQSEMSLKEMVLLL